jgi:rare lipoprotein A
MRTLRSLLITALLASSACGTESPDVRSEPRTAAKLAVPETHDAFDPRSYYNRKALAVRKGAASFYADSFAGRKTANGERYDPDAYTAAHRSWPFGTVLRVTRPTTGAWVLVRVNDRGPYGPGTRVLDLSKQAAKRLSMMRDGVVPVRIEVLEWGARR